MAKIFQDGQRIVPTWLGAVNELRKQKSGQRNYLLEIAQPTILTDQDKAVIALVDASLREHRDLSVKTVAGTIFPLGMYRRFGRPAFYAEFTQRMKRAQKEHTWGTYALRMMERRGTKPGTVVNPLEQIVQKLLRASSDEGHAYHNNYELGVAEPADDLGLEEPYGCELPTFDVARDGSRVANLPCLSHLSFKMTNKDQVDLTAIYRSHYYCERALGNLIGLSQLLQFVATESKLKVGTLSCLSTHAEDDFRSWGSAAEATKLLADMNAAAV